MLVSGRQQSARIRLLKQPARILLPLAVSDKVPLYDKVIEKSR
jgi:hypothetical protein